MRRFATILFLVSLAANVLGKTCYVDPDASGAQTGESWTNAYISADQWEAHEQAVLGETMTVWLRASQGTPDVNTLYITGWTTYADKYIELKGYDGTYKLITSDTGTTPTFRVREEYVRVSGIWFEQASLSSNVAVCLYEVVAAGTDLRMDSCVIKAPTSIYQGLGLHTNDADVNLKINNTLIYNLASGTGDISAKFQGYANVYMYNCTIIGGLVGILDSAGAGNLIVKNTIVNGATTCCDINDATTTFSTNNLSSDATMFGDNAILNTSLTFAGATYHLDSTDTAAIDAGVTLTSDPNIAVTDDYDGDARPQGGGFDLGYDEYVPPGGGEGAALVKKRILFSGKNGGKQ